MAEEQNKEDAAPAASKVDEAKELLKKIEQANKETKAWVERAEALKAEAVISGESEAGKPAEKPKEESPEEYAEKVMRNEVETS